MNNNTEAEYRVICKNKKDTTYRVALNDAELTPVLEHRYNFLDSQGKLVAIVQGTEVIKSNHEVV
jgi:hypothetical protein